MLKSIFLVISLIFIGSCRKDTDISNVDVDINLPSNSYNSPKILESIELFKEARQKGTAEYSVAQFFDILALTEEEKDYIAQNRSGKMQIQCSQAGSCSARNSGNAFKFTASQVQVPTIGTPKFIVGPNISLKLKVFSDNLVKICEVKGVKIRKGFLTVNMDGATITRHGQNYKVVTDAGIGGSYPSRECD